MDFGRCIVLVISLLFALSSFDIVSSSTPTIPCYKIENPEYHKNLVLNSKLYEENFQNWELTNVTVPCIRSISSIEEGAGEVVLNFVVPDNYSPHGLTYMVSVYVYSINDSVRFSQNGWSANNYIEDIIRFESLEPVSLFIEHSGNVSVRNEPSSRFFLESKSREYSRDYLSYNLIEKEISSLRISEPILIDKMDLFIPQSSTIPLVSEFNEKVGIKSFSGNADHIQISENILCHTCDQYVDHNIRAESPSEYLLRNNITWESLPEIKEIHFAIKERFLENELAGCIIDNNGYTSKKHLRSVGLSCSVGEKSIITLRTLQDGTYEKIIYDRPLTSFAKNNPNYFYIIIFLIVLVILTIGFLVFRKKSRDKKNVGNA